MADHFFILPKNDNIVWFDFGLPVNDHGRTDGDQRLHGTRDNPKLEHGPAVLAQFRKFLPRNLTRLHSRSH